MVPVERHEILSISIVKKKYPGVPIIAITGWVEDIKDSRNKINADQLFKKPFDIGDLERSISELLSDKEPAQSVN